MHRVACGVVSLAVGNRLVSAGISVHQTAGIIAAALLPFSFEFLWAPVVDACWNRRGWFVFGAFVMSACLAALIVAPWNSGSVWLMTALAFSSCCGALLARALCGY